MHLNVADGDRLVELGDVEFGALGNGAGEHGAGDDGTHPARAEHPVDVVAEKGCIGCLPRRKGKKGLLECRDRLGSVDRGGEDGEEFHGGVFGKECFDFVCAPGEEIGIGKVAFVQCHDDTAYPGDPQDIEVLQRLGHDPVIRRDHEQRRIEAKRPADHVFDQLLMPGDIDKGDVDPILLHIRKTQIDRDPPLLLFGHLVAVVAGHRLDESGFAVVDVSGGADDYISHAVPPERVNSE